MLFPGRSHCRGRPASLARVRTFVIKRRPATRPPDCRTGAVTCPWTCVHDWVSSQRYIQLARLLLFRCVIHVRDAAASIGRFADVSGLVVIQRTDDHIVFDAGTTVVNVGLALSPGSRRGLANAHVQSQAGSPEVIANPTSLRAVPAALAPAKVDGCPPRFDVDRRPLRNSPCPGCCSGRRARRRRVTRAQAGPVPGWSHRRSFWCTPGEVRGKQPAPGPRRIPSPASSSPCRSSCPVQALDPRTGAETRATR